MDKRDKQREVFVKLANKQLEPHGVTYEDVKNQPDWYMKYTTTRAIEKEFTDWGVNLIIEELGMTRTLAEKEISWFILQWGLTTGSEFEEDTLDTVKVEVTRTKKSK